MESSSSLPGSTSGPAQQHKWARIVGTVIALLTLTVPAWAIAYYSSVSSPLGTITPPTPTTYPLRRAGD